MEEIQSTHAKDIQTNVSKSPDVHEKVMLISVLGQYFISLLHLEVGKRI